MQKKAEPIGETMNTIRDVLQDWLGHPAWKLTDIFKKYCTDNGTPIPRELFHKNLEAKRLNIDFRSDMDWLLPEKKNWNFDEAFDFVQNNIISRLP